MRLLYGKARALAGDRRGGIAVLFGLSAFVLFLLAGVAIDSSRAYNVSFKLQDGLDAAALAAAKLLDDSAATETDFQHVGESYFKSYFDALRVDNISASNIRVTPNYADWTVTVSADVSIRTVLGNLSKIATFDYTPSSTVVYKPKKIEMALVLDITGSMCDSPPFSPAVACTTGAKIGALKNAATEMVNELASTGPSPDSIKIAVVPYSASVNLGANASYLTAGASTDGCLVERTGTAAYTDTGPASAFPVASTATYPAYSCPTPDVLGLNDIADSTKRQQVLTKIADLAGHGGTAGHLGLAWGWYALSPNWSAFWPTGSRPRAHDPDRVIKAVVLMTDGMFNTSYNNGGEAVAWPSSASTDPTITGTSGYQALQLCEEMKKAGNDVQIYTVGFQTPSDAEALLKECSGDDNFYNADNASQLSGAFKDIAKRLTNIRVSS